MIFRRKNKKKHVIDKGICDFTQEEIAMYKFAQPFTMTSPERVKALVDSIKYIVGNGIEGSFIECGVWKGGSVLVMLKVLNELQHNNYEIFLFDTFEGMSKPTDFDIDPTGIKAKDRYLLENNNKKAGWCEASIEEVKDNLSIIPYPQKQLHFIKGEVEVTLKTSKPKKIALLRLDTDWYESTKIELEELYDLVVPGGVIIIDDYGHWSGCKKAVDEFFLSRNEFVLLHRIDYTGRLIIKK